MVSKDQTDQILRDIQQHQEEAWVIGNVVACPKGNKLLRVAFLFLFVVVVVTVF